MARFIAAETEGFQEVDRSCRGCGKLCTAKVFSQGAGEARVLPFMADVAEENAYGRALAGMARRARAVAHLAPCPHCGAVDNGVATPVLLRTALRGAVFGAPLALIVATIAVLSGGGPFAFPLGAAAVLLVAMAFVVRERSKLRYLGRTVEWMEADAPA